MHHDIIARPSYSALKFLLDTGDEIHAESGAMLAMDETTDISGKMKGGLWGALKRTVLTSESFFVTEIKATQNNTEVYLAPRAVGDIEKIELQNEEYIVQGGSFLACEPGIHTDAKFTGWKGFVSGEGIFMIKANGTGTMFVSSFGGIIQKELAAGETFIVDNGHMVAFPANMKYDIRQVGKGIGSMVSTGEGLAVVCQGPGTIYLQTRNLQTFAETLNPFLRDRGRSQGSGLLGNIFGS